MSDIHGQAWWVVTLRGVLAIIFGLLAMALPGLTLILLVAIFAVYALLGGIVSVVGATRYRAHDPHWWQLLLLGVASIGAGTIAVVSPALTAMALVLLMGVNALVTGVLDIVIATRLRRIVSGQWLLILTGIASIAFAGVVFAFPAAGALALAWLISVYALVTGLLLTMLGLSLRHSPSSGGLPRPVPL